MAKEEHYYTKFEKGKLYHIYNRAINKQPLFITDENYAFFLRKLYDYISDVADVYVYNLLGNHFHFSIKIKSNFEHLVGSVNKREIIDTHKLVSKRLRRFFQSYAQAFNKQHDRVGSLFQTPYKRVLIEDEDNVKKLVRYIHLNAQHHGLVSDFRNWKWSSYQEILKGTQAEIHNEIIRWFGSKKDFLDFHNFPQTDLYIP